MPTPIRRPTSSSQTRLRSGEVPTSPATRLRWVDDGAGNLVLASSGRVAAALVADGAGGYVLTPGATTSDAMIAQILDNIRDGGGAIVAQSAWVTRTEAHA